MLDLKSGIATKQALLLQLKSDPPNPEPCVPPLLLHYTALPFLLHHPACRKGMPLSRSGMPARGPCPRPSGAQLSGWLRACGPGRRRAHVMRARVCCRGEGASDRQLAVVADADAMDFVGTKRLEGDWPGYSWRTALSPGWFRFYTLTNPPPAPRPRRPPADPVPKAG